MSDPNSRRGADRSPRTPERQLEVLRLIADLQRHAEIEQALRQRYDARGEAAARMRQWFFDHLHTMEPTPGQRHDSHLEPYIGFPLLAKGSTSPMHFYGRTNDIRKRPGGTVIHATINAREASPAMLREAFAKVDRLQLRQMHNLFLKSAGIVLDAKVSNDGIIEIECLVSDPTAAMKCAQRAYTGVLLTMDGGEIADVSVVDSPAGFLEKRADTKVIAKVFTNESKVMSKLMKKAKKLSKKTGFSVQECADALSKVGPPMRLSPSATQALNRYNAAVAAVPGAGDAMAAKAAVGRALGDIGVEMVKAARSRPVAIGADGLVNFLRHGRR